MSWRGKYRQASYRGAAFYVDAAEGEYGRRGANHVFPQRDKGYWEDLGDKDAAFTIEGYVLGADYMAARDALIAAVREAGPGELVHPYLGTRRVVCTGCRVRESSRDGGMASFSLSFLEAGERPAPSAAIDTAATVHQAADAAHQASGIEWFDTFTVDGHPDFVADAAAADLAHAVAVVQAVAGRLPGTPAAALAGFVDAAAVLLGIDGAGAAIDTASLFARTAKRLAATGAAAAAGDVATAATGLVRLLTPLAGTPRAGYQAQRALWSHGRDLPAIPQTTPSRRQQAANQAAIAGLVRRAAVIEAARVATVYPFDSYDEAVVVRDELADALDAEMATATDPVYLGLADLRAAVVRDVTDRGANLSRIVRWTPPATMPALVATYEVYEDIGREADLVARNSLRHPGFVPGGEALELLSRA